VSVTTVPNDSKQRSGPVPETAEARLSRLQDEAEVAASRLASIGPTLAVAQLGEMSDRYAELQSELAVAEEEWLGTLRAALHASSA
jgi:hypothetical protein